MDISYMDMGYIDIFIFNESFKFRRVFIEFSFISEISSKLVSISRSCHPSGGIGMVRQVLGMVGICPVKLFFV